MAASAEKRSLGHPRLPGNAPSRRLDDNDAYRLMVLRYDQPEEEVDRTFLQKALDLGINTPRDTKTTLDLIEHSVTSLRFEATPSTAPAQTTRADSRLDSRKSQSIHAPSDSSVDSKGHRKTPSLAATSITSVPSTTSANSDKSNYVKIKQGFKRLSTLRGNKRKTLQSQPSAPNLPIRPSTVSESRPPLQARSNTADRIAPLSQPQSPVIASPPLSPTGRPTGRRKLSSMPISSPMPQAQIISTPTSPILMSSPTSTKVPNPRTPPPPPESFDDPEQLEHSSSPEALERSLANPRLRRFRTSQLQEQLRFISFRASQTRLMRTRHLQLKRDRLAAYKAVKSEAEQRHAETLSDLEHRHLSAEEDLQTQLETERQACDTRLKHMQAYCNPQENIERGMPAREVTPEDHMKLQSQFHIRRQMDNLHGSRINVLRERQAKQVERITAKLEKEAEKLAADFGRENEALDAGLEEQELDLQREFEERKARLTSRWQMSEAIERRTLELETGESYGPLPEIGWGDEGKDGEEAEGEMRRLFLEKRIIFDPEQGFMEMEEPLVDADDDEDVVPGAHEFDSGNVI